MVDENNRTSRCIRMAMAGAELTNIELAEKLNVSRMTVGRWKTKGCDSVSMLERIAKACGMTYADLMALSGE